MKTSSPRRSSSDFISKLNPNFRKSSFVVFVAAASCLSWAAPVCSASAIISGFDSQSMTRNDDSSFGPVSLGFSLNFYGVNVIAVYVNNNGNVTLGSAYGAYTPGPIGNVGKPIFAPFFADVDTSTLGNSVKYGSGTVDGHSAFGVTWNHVAYYGSTNSAQLNSFQMIIIDRSDIEAGDFDFWFNYDDITWEAGKESGGVAGLGGQSARVGYSNGAATTFELPGSAVNGAFLNGGVDALVSHSLNSDVQGRYIFSVRDGIASVPEPQTMDYLVVLAGLFLVWRFVFRRPAVPARRWQLKASPGKL